MLVLLKEGWRLEMKEQYFFGSHSAGHTPDPTVQRSLVANVWRFEGVKLLFVLGYKKENTTPGDSSSN